MVLELAPRTPIVQMGTHTVGEAGVKRLSHIGQVKPLESIPLF